MWLLGFIPDWLMHYLIIGLFILGFFMYFSGLLIRFVPAAAVYKEPLKFFAVVIVALGVYLYGCNDTQVYWKQKIAESQAVQNKKIEVAEVAVTKATTEVVVKHETKKKTIAAAQVKIEEQIKQEAPKIDAECKIDPAAIKLLNDAAKYPVKETK